MNIRNKLGKVIPSYAVPRLLIALVFNCMVYFGTRLFSGALEYRSFALGIDQKIPFRVSWIIIYCLAYFFWIVNYILISRESFGHCRRVLYGEIIAKAICLICFLLIPTTLDRPVPEGSDFCSRLARLLFSLDAPNNLFPSIHCLESYLCWRGLVGCKKVPYSYKAFSFAFMLLVFASTLLVKQHVIIDIPAGILAGDIGLLFARLLLRRRKETPEHDG